MILLANNLENEVKLQKNKMKEMEDYLDNLLLRVMETHPKILQNPYRMQSSVKRLVCCTNLLDFLLIFFHFELLFIQIYSLKHLSTSTQYSA